MDGHNPNMDSNICLRYYQGMTEEEIYFALDLGFSDGHNDENVRELTIRNHRSAIAEAIVLMTLDEAICFSLFRELGQARPSPEIYAMDFPSDLRASLYLLLGGYYKQAILCLRNWLEMRVLGIYFDLVSASRYADWKHGAVSKDDPLFGWKLLRQLFQRAEFQRADKRNGLRDRIKVLYGDLSVFAHGQGLSKHDLQRETDNVPRCNPQSVDLYLDLLRRVFQEIAYCSWLAYNTKSFSQLNKEERSRFLAAVGSVYRSEIEAKEASRGSST
jgi:hypothetical protein